MSKTTFSVSCSLWAGGLQFSKKMNNKDLPQENLQNFKKDPFGKASVVESAFNKIAGIDSGPATLSRYSPENFANF